MTSKRYVRVVIKGGEKGYIGLVYHHGHRTLMDQVYKTASKAEAAAKERQAEIDEQAKEETARIRAELAALEKGNE